MDMNMQTQNENTFQREHNLAIAKDLVRNLRERKAVGWIGNVKAIIPLLVRPKEIDPIEILEFRWLKDGKSGSDLTPSMKILS